MSSLWFKILFGVYVACDVAEMSAKVRARRYIRYAKLSCWLVFFILAVIYK